ncbi:hypothetical protein E5Q_03309 [Mixia osmundae IAM 14324]|uniref:CDP-diacylglycerol--glycerol-3-phosphate 3-phosphatidyltransferase n=1 Tax=Mixia osmundae (strain CBS 9802 / IAM 14324 / JCM 22182 / KY 12970) TaxID=764103 RepID=G7E1C9_MIXOS|nr:hypothetical protein E5Q_03309 [Mixia osmundae IAM 14324]
MLSTCARSARALRSPASALRLGSACQLPQQVMPRRRQPAVGIRLLQCGLSWKERRSFASTSPSQGPLQRKTSDEGTLLARLNTLPNILTLSRIASCPLLGYFIIQGDLKYATALLAYAGITDGLDGWLARRWGMGSAIGSILDPAADKILMTTLVVSLTARGLLPAPLAFLILGRDIALALRSFYYRWQTLAPPRTFRRYWDLSKPFAEIKPTQISKYNTVLQLLLMGVTTIHPLLPYDIASPLLAFQWLVAVTTVWSGVSYVFASNTVRRL